MLTKQPAAYEKADIKNLRKQEKKLRDVFVNNSGEYFGALYEVMTSYRRSTEPRSFRDFSAPGPNIASATHQRRQIAS